MSIVSLVLMGTSALSPGYAYEPINTDARGVAIEGYDPVAYFTQGKAVEGSEEFSYHWMGAMWHFASGEHLEMFKSNPERYAPQYGGYWAYQVAMGRIARADPRLWKIVEGRLYLNCSESVKRTWEGDIPGYIDKANKQWPHLLK